MQYSVKAMAETNMHIIQKVNTWNVTNVTKFHIKLYQTIKHNLTSSFIKTTEANTTR